MSLFRKEVLENRADRLHGEVSLALPMSWQVIGYLFFAALIAAALFLSLASYARTETVAGAIVADRGVAEIVPTRAGVVTKVWVKDRQLVAPGTPLVSVRAEETLISGGSAQEQAIAVIAQQDASLASQSRAISMGGSAEQARLSAQIGGFRQEIISLTSQIGLQRELVASAKAEMDRAKIVAERGFISRRDLQVREEQYLGRRQQLAQLEAARASKSAAVDEAERSRAQSMAQAWAQEESLVASRAELTQRLNQTQASRAYLLTAPLDGRVTSLTARAGQPTNNQLPLMTIVPANSKLRAELYVPTSAIGFLAVGQNVRLAVAAFPYQRFGTVNAKIIEVSGAATGKPDANGNMMPVYLVTAEITDPMVLAFGKAQPLLPGMTLSARIIAEKRSLIEWLFEPLLAVKHR